MPKSQVAVSQAIPAPIGGWNTRDPLDLMADTDALRMINYFPSTASVDLRRGFRSHSTGMGSAAVETVAEHVGATGTRTLIACANSNIYNATTYGGSASSLASGLTNNKWQTVNFRDAGGNSYLMMVNGADVVKAFNGTAISNPAFTGVTLSNLIDVTTFKGRLYFVEKDSTSIWYGDIDASSGALTELDVGSLFKRGGYLLTAASWTRDTGGGSQDLLALISSQGDVLIYGGTDPGATDWGLVGRLYLPAPIGRRCLGNIGSELVIITNQGLIPFSSIINVTPEKESNFVKLTDKISSAFAAASESYGTNFGWQFIPYFRGKMGIVNIPIIAGSQAEQAVVNTLTGAWCKFTGINASSWCLFNDKPYFGGVDGKVYEFDYGYNDGGNEIPVQLKTAFNYLGDRQSLKKITLARVMAAAQGDISFTFNIDTDFQDRPLSDTISLTGSSGSDWDTSDWDTSSWDSGTVYSQDTYSVDGLGRCVAVRVQGNYRDLSHSISAFHLVYEQGGFY